MAKSLEEIFNAPQGKKSLEEIFSAQAPIEQPQPEKKSFGGFVGNVFSSGAKLIGNTASGLANVFNPNPEKNTIANVARLGAGLVQKIIPGKQSQEKYADAVGNYYKDRYGGAQNIADTAYNDPVGFASDASVLLGGGAALLKGAGAVSKSSAFTKAGQVASKASSVVDPIQVGAKAFSKPISAVAASRPAQATAERLANFALRTPSKNASQGTAQAFLQRGFGGKSLDTVVKRTGEEIQTTGQTIKNTLKTSGQTFKTSQILDEAVSSARASGSQITRKALQDRLARFVPDYAPLLRKKTLTATEANNLRAAIDTNLKEATFLGKQLTTEQSTIKGFNRSLRTNVKDRTGTQDLFRKESEAIRINKLAKSAAEKAATQGRPGFLDIASVGVGGAVGGIPGAAVGLAAERILRSPRFQGLLAQVIYNSKDFDKVVARLAPAEKTLLLNIVNQLQKTTEPLPEFQSSLPQ